MHPRSYRLPHDYSAVPIAGLGQTILFRETSGLTERQELCDRYVAADPSFARCRDMCLEQAELVTAHEQRFIWIVGAAAVALVAGPGAGWLMGKT